MYLPVFLFAVSGPNNQSNTLLSYTFCPQPKEMYFDADRQWVIVRCFGSGNVKEVRNALDYNTSLCLSKSKSLHVKQKYIFRHTIEDVRKVYTLCDELVSNHH